MTLSLEEARQTQRRLMALAAEIETLSGRLWKQARELENAIVKCLQKEANHDMDR